MIFKAAVTNPEIIQPIKDSVIKPKQMHQINTEKQFDAEKQYDPVEEYDNAGLNTNLIDFTNINKQNTFFPFFIRLLSTIYHILNPLFRLLVIVQI